MIGAIRRVLGEPFLPVKGMPWLIMRLASPFVPFLREVMEMRYLWQVPVRLDNAKLVATLGSEPHTPIEEAVRGDAHRDRVPWGCRCREGNGRGRGVEGLNGWSAWLGGHVGPPLASRRLDKQNAMAAEWSDGRRLPPGSGGSGGRDGHFDCRIGSRRRKRQGLAMTKRSDDAGTLRGEAMASLPKPPAQHRPSFGSPGRFAIGAAIGAGLVARAAVRGGADFILALSAGRVRVMGAPSVVSMLPIHESNAFVAEFARAEILGRVDVPVLFGASTLDPRTDIRALVRQIAAWGFDGVINFPSVILLDDDARARMAHAGLGWQREVELISAAKEAGLFAAAYVRTAQQAADMATAGCGLVCVNFGWTAGGVAGEPATQDTADAAAEAKAVFRQVRRIRPKTLCFLEGGPIATPQAAAEVCQASNADGYIASSTIDRIPLETAVFDVATAFKAVAGLTRKVEALKNEMLGDGRRFGLYGRSAAMTQLVRMIERLADSDLTVMIQGRAAPARNWWRRRCIEAVVGATVRSSPSTAPPSRAISWKASCSALNAVPSPAPTGRASGGSRRPTGERCSWTRLAISICRCRASCCVFSKPASSNGSAAISRAS